MTSAGGAPIAITPGDAAGIGPEIVARAFLEAPQAMRGCFVAGDMDAMRRAAGVVAGGVGLPLALLATPVQAWNAPPRCVPVLQVLDAAPLPAFGVVSPVAGRQAAQCVTWAARAALRGNVAAMVTAPLHKEALAAAGVPFPGHTELLQHEAAAHLGVPVDRLPVRMMLANDELRVVLASIHVSLLHAIAAVTAENVLQTLRIADDSIGAGLHRPPRLAVAGLNPHAGEGGLFGSEERDAISPAIQAARALGIDAHGPFAPDTVFMRARARDGRPGEFDAVIAMYHDQGLIPVKYLGVDKGVNVTLGLPLVRTSPDHGTAFDIAGSGKADPASLLAAVAMARQLAAVRAPA